MSAAFSPDGSRIVTASKDRTARIWDTATGKEIAVLRGHVNFVIFRRLQPRRLAHRHGVGRQDRAHLGRRQRARRSRSCAATRTVYLRRLQPRRLAHRHGVKGQDRPHLGRRNGKEIAVLRGHGSYVSSAAFSPDGSRIVTASEDKTARIWDARIATMSTRSSLPTLACGCAASPG